MLHTEVRIVEKGQPAPFPELGSKKMHHCGLDRVVILEAGMASGRASVALLVDLPDGSVAFIETSAQNFYNAACAAKGACQRWGQDL